MVAAVDLIEAADRNFLGSYRKLVDHMPSGATRDFGGVFAFVTGLPIGMFNGCIVPAPATTEDFTSALDWIVEHDVPYRLWIHEELADQLAETVRGRGMEQAAWLMPQMVLQPVPETPSPAPGVSVRAVSDARSLDEYRQVSVEDGTSEDVARRLFSDSFAADSDVQLVIAYLDDRAVGTSLAIRTGDVSGVYAVGTLAAARRRGVGTAATWAAVAAGRAWGCETIVLQASEMGFPVYRTMGFRTVVSYALFRPSA
jgi:GNAT superfamily N-acetyltransferase